MFHIENQENYFVDPFGNFDIKIIATVSYILALPGCCVAFCFVWYEASGSAGPYRTCINQLVSRLYLVVSFNCVCISLVDLIRVWNGPLPELICTPMQVTWYRHIGFFTFDSIVSYENLDCLYPEICTYHG